MTVALDLLALGVLQVLRLLRRQLRRACCATPGSARRCRCWRSRCRSGLSFFTFQAISYMVDVRRGLCERASTIDFAIYLSFFPHLVAGPIVRAREFLPQLRTPARPARRRRSAPACC